MNLHVRFSAVVALAALTWTAAPLCAQSEATSDVRDTSVTSVATSLAPMAVIDSITAVTLAQSAQPNSSVAESRGPSRSVARVASHSLSKPRGAVPALQNRTSNRNAVALMIVGGAALVVGAVIGDDAGTLVMLGGAGIGLYGLYLFLT